jgi:hypothetical protein
MTRTAPACQGDGDVVEMVPAYQTVNLNQYNKCQARKAWLSFWGTRLTIYSGSPSTSIGDCGVVCWPGMVGGL